MVRLCDSANQSLFQQLSVSQNSKVSQQCPELTFAQPYYCHNLSIPPSWTLDFSVLPASPAPPTVLQNISNSFFTLNCLTNQLTNQPIKIYNLPID